MIVSLTVIERENYVRVLQHNVHYLKIWQGKKTNYIRPNHENAK